MSETRRIDGTRTCLIIEVPTGCLPVLRAWGPRIDDDADQGVAALTAAQSQATVDAPLPLDLLPLHARGFQGAPGLRGAFLDGTGWAPDPDRIDTTWFDDGLRTLADDRAAGLRLHVEIRLDEHDVVRLRAAVTNIRGLPVDNGSGAWAHDPIGAPAAADPTPFPVASPGIGRPRATDPSTDDYRLDALCLTLPVGDQAREVASYAGRWIREFHLQRQPWTIGRVERVNVRGRSSHEDPPLMLAGSAGFSQEHGEVWAVHLAWSGNSEQRAERTADGFAHLQVGEHLHPGELTLRPGETYVTPTVYAVCSSSGLNGVSDAFHAHIRARSAHPERPRPVTLNTWEAVYFDHDPDKLEQLVDVAAEVGIERFVLDDGWFLGRRDDTAGLGDWSVDPHVHPAGLEPLAERVRGAGMEFGLWFEPEMVNPDSVLFRNDPTVTLTRTSGPTTRNQHVLDVAREDLWTHLHERIGTLISTIGVAYVKWDLNRDHVAAEHRGVASTHAQVTAVYSLLEQLVADHDGLEIETCSGGGGRVDLGILAHTHRVWTSDTNDPIERQRIQRGASILLPPELLGCHVGPPTAHTTGRTSSLALRIATAFFGHLGVEWDLTQADTEALAHLAAAIELHRHWRDVLHHGRVVRVDHPDDHTLVQGVVSDERALFSHCQLASGPWARPSVTRLPGLPQDRSYRIRLVDLLTDPPAGGRMPGWYGEGSIVLTGRHLAQHGIALHAHHPESITVIALEQAG